MASIMQLGEAMGKVADRLSNELHSMASSMGKDATPGETAKLQAKSALFANALSASSNVLKTVSDAEATVARNVKA